MIDPLGFLGIDQVDDFSMMSSVSGQWGILGVFFDVLEVLGDWEIPHLQIIDVFACFCHQGLH